VSTESAATVAATGHLPVGGRFNPELLRYVGANAALLQSGSYEEYSVWQAPAVFDEYVDAGTDWRLLTNSMAKMTFLATAAHYRSRAS